MLARSGKPALIEKPLALDLATAENLCELVEREAAPMMVSTNRRFYPLVLRVRELLAGRKVAYVRATILRRDRPGLGFFYDAVFHPADTFRFLLGEVVAHEVRPCTIHNGEAARCLWRFGNGAQAVLEADPLSARWCETIEFFGEGFQLVLDLRQGLRLFEQGALAYDELLDHKLPLAVWDGTYGETLAFREACEGYRTFDPLPSDTLRTMRLVDYRLDGTFS